MRTLQCALALSPPWLRPTNDVRMEMVHLLPAVGPGVDQRFKSAAGAAVGLHFKTATMLLRQFRCKQQHLTQHSRLPFVAVGQGRHMLLRHDQQMHGRGRINIVKSDQVVIFMNSIRWNDASDDLAKNTVVQGGLHDVSVEAIAANNYRKQLPQTIAATMTASGVDRPAIGLTLLVLFTRRQLAAGFFFDAGDAFTACQFIQHLLRREVELCQHDQRMKP